MSPHFELPDATIIVLPMIMTVGPIQGSLSDVYFMLTLIGGIEVLVKYPQGHAIRTRTNAAEIPPELAGVRSRLLDAMEKYHA